MSARTSGFLLGVAISSGALAADTFKESDYRKAGAPDCGATAQCAIGLVTGDDRHRFKVYVSSDDELNGKMLVLAESTNSGDDLRALAGQVVLVGFSAVADKHLLEAKVIGLAPAPSGDTAKSDDDETETASVASDAPAAITNIDLSRWKVTLPIHKPGRPGSALEVTELTGFSMPPYFDVKPNSITFSASTEGVRTSGSNYPRSELREMDGNGDEYEWTVAQGGTLSATLFVEQVPTRTAVAAGSAPAPTPIKVPSPGRIIIGQIHGPDDELCRLYYDNGTLYFNDDKSGPDGEQLSFPLKNTAGEMTNIPLGESFSYTIDVNADRLEVTAVVNGETYRGSEPIGPFWPGKALYFKAGAYVQVGAPGGEARETGEGTGTVTFTEIELKH